MRDLDGSNDGAKRGTITHLILELLLTPRHQKHIHAILKHGAANVKPINRLILKHARILQVDDKDNLELIYKFIKVGLTEDFFCEGWDLQPAEWDFKIENDSPRYKILGFLDKHAHGIGERSHICRIDDYKTSKAKFSGKDKDFNIQALMYALAVWKTKEFKEFEVNFLFLKIKNPWMTYRFTEDHMRGFEHYLANIYGFLEDFNVKKAMSNFGIDKVDTFRLCGKPGVRPGTKKDDGSPAWICPYKYPFLYFELKNKDGKIIATSKTKQNLLDKMGDGDTLSEKFYGGCASSRVRSQF